MRVRPFILAYGLGTVVLTPLLIGYGLFLTLAVLWAWAGCFFYLPAVMPNNGCFGPLVTRFRTTRREVWITIDDGPDPEDTPQMLKLLAQYRARATFFLIGKRAALYPELVREILRQGHTWGNHSFHHPVASFWLAQPRRLGREMDLCAEVLSTLARDQPACGFRAPVGMVNIFVHPALKKRRLKLIGWSARGFDKIWTDPEKIVERLWQGVRPGAILLLHEGHHPPGKEALNPRCLELLLARLQSAGYQAVIPGQEQLEER